MEKSQNEKQLKRRDSIKSELSDGSEISGCDFLDRIDLDVSQSIQGFVFHSSKLAETIEIFDRLWEKTKKNKSKKNIRMMQFSVNFILSHTNLF